MINLMYSAWGSPLLVKRMWFCRDFCTLCSTVTQFFSLTVIYGTNRTAVPRHALTLEGQTLISNIISTDLQTVLNADQPNVLSIHFWIFLHHQHDWPKVYTGWYLQIYEYMISSERTVVLQINWNKLRDINQMNKSLYLRIYCFTWRRGSSVWNCCIRFRLVFQMYCGFENCFINVAHWCEIYCYHWPDYEFHTDSHSLPSQTLPWPSSVIKQILYLACRWWPEWLRKHMQDVISL